MRTMDRLGNPATHGDLCESCACDPEIVGWEAVQELLRRNPPGRTARHASDPEGTSSPCPACRGYCDEPELGGLRCYQQ